MTFIILQTPGYIQPVGGGGGGAGGTIWIGSGSSNTLTVSPTVSLRCLN